MTKFLLETFVKPINFKFKMANDNTQKEVTLSVITFRLTKFVLATNTQTIINDLANKRLFSILTTYPFRLAPKRIVTIPCINKTN